METSATTEISELFRTAILKNNRGQLLRYCLFFQVQLVKLQQANISFFLFDIKKYSPEVSCIQRREAEFNVIFLRVNNFDIKC